MQYTLCNFTAKISIICVIYTLSTAQINLSPIGTATQSSTYRDNNNYYYTAGLAITGGPTNDFSSGSCSHTGTFQQAAWWMLALPNNSLFVEQVNIFYQSGRSKRLDGYSLYLSNTSITGLQKQTPPGYLCYKDILDGISSINQTVACNQAGQYVILYNANTVHGDNAPFLALCDVQVFGCPKERFGPQCSKLCSPKCFDQHCYPTNGRCVFGCNCLEDNCDVSELCTAGCKDGFVGQFCNKACSPPHFGQKCMYTCHCKNQQNCNHIDGTCPPGGCQDGWKGTSCSTECPPSTFGENCVHTCHCENQQVGCYNTDGTCPEGECQKGWQGKNCTTVCPFPRFGENCNHICHCRNQSLGCNHIDGRCNMEGCEKGWYGENCSKVQTKTSSMSTEIIASVTATVFVVAVATFVVFLLRKQKILNGGTCIFNKPIRYVKKTDDKTRKDNMDHLYEHTRQTNIGDHCYSTISPTVKSVNTVKGQGKDIHLSKDYVNDAYELSDQIKNDKHSYTNLNLNVKALTAERRTDIQYNDATSQRHQLMEFTYHN